MPHAGRTMLIGLAVCVLLAVTAASVSLREMTLVARGLEAHTVAAEREGSANRQIERVDDLSREAETRLFEWLVDPSDDAVARRSLRGRDGLMAEVRRASAVLPAEPTASLLPAARQVDAAFAGVRSAIAGADPAAAEHAMANEFVPVLSKLQRVLDQIRLDLSRRRAERLDAVDDRLERSRLAALVSAVLLVAGLVVVWVWSLRAILGHRLEIEANVTKLQRANAELDAFAGRVAHELRNVLAPLSLSAEYLAATCASPESRMGIERLDRSIRLSSAVVRDLLEFARAGQPSSGVTRVAPLVDELIEDRRTRARDGNVELTGSADDVTVTCSRGLLHTLLANLFDNAIKFTSGNGGGHVQVRATSSREGCMITVVDDGPGIAPEAVPHVFEPFYRAAGSAVPGVGIGLATVHRIATAHGGEIEVESQLGEGTRVRVWLPRAHAELASANDDVDVA